MATYRASRAREAYGGINWGAGFFGWLVAVAVSALLTALLAAAGAVIALGEVDVDVEGLETDELGIGGAIGLVVTALISYFTGGYVAGRMSRFDGARQGFAVWLWAIIVAIVLAILGWLADQEWNVLAELDLPRIPADETVTGLGVATLIVIFLGTLLAAIGGGIVGVRYHSKVTDAALTGAPPARDGEAARRDHEAAAREDRVRDEDRPPADRSAEEEGRRPPPPRE
ncbi:MAG TPA: YrzE family protein [Solirubrobacterales bacterium]|nr:YrzE family protein [Solirubrobacterales bacterium]